MEPRISKDFGLKFFAATAVVGFLLSLLIHIRAVFGGIIFEHPMFFHLGLILVLIPAVSVAKKSGQREPIKEFWKHATEYALPWMKGGVKVLFIYELVGLILYAVETKDTNKHYAATLHPLLTIRGFSSHWMLLYFAALTMLYSAIEKRKQTGLTHRRGL